MNKIIGNIKCCWRLVAVFVALTAVIGSIYYLIEPTPLLAVH
ncbi:MAG: hypothetical protein ABIG66_00685 [Candidatus Kerfeldbacteria bacterium]